MSLVELPLASALIPAGMPRYRQVPSYTIYALTNLTQSHGMNRRPPTNPFPTVHIAPSGYSMSHTPHGPSAVQARPSLEPQRRCDQCHSDAIIAYERNKMPKTLGPGGVLVTDILAFRDCLKHSGAHMLCQSPGPVSVGTQTFSERIPGNCEHRPITSHNLAWWLAKHLQNNLKNNIAGLYLLSLFTRDGHAWTANVRYADGVAQYV
ncbi:hypothetical protein C8R44DRAFT_974152 [Mycena epipterygia]|nr:hypothetical protein C8R44DRAFT_974152 [Mycena epipterygia]